ncbi:MAG TPA: phosphoadenylyl-sulfate reductase [Saprospiraceae bacterium]|nr:phosphoadenylyl-sulfate reductase [Saprospiraceae bacterium]HMQ83880.1 phosphoadenylyl-sulfate reductase [Saprospiraceae bacterium]
MTTYLKAWKAAQDSDLNWLNRVFTPLSYQDRIQKLYHFFGEEEVMVTSSFGTSSVFLLHVLSQERPTQKIHFIDTGYHFPETLAYKQELTDLLNLQVVSIHPDAGEHNFTQSEALWKSDTNRCCQINKVNPLEGVKAQHKVWVSGLMSHQTEFRAGLQVFERQGRLLKFHPFIDVDEGELLYQLGIHQLPAHPLEAQGFGSIGCSHCTVQGQGREGRWKDSEKTECGLHPDYFTKRLIA